MKRRVIIVDTSMLVTWLEVPGFETAGSDKIDKTGIDRRLENYRANGANLLLTIACMIETGNHIAQIKAEGVRKEVVNKFADFVKKAVEGRDGWLIYYSEHEMWSKERLLGLTEDWRTKGIYKLSLGDASILTVAAELKASNAFEVEVFTADAQLLALSQASPRHEYIPKQKRN